MKSIDFTHLGDGVFSHFDGEHIWLIAKHRDGLISKICITDETMVSLFQFIEQKLGIKISTTRIHGDRPNVH